VNTINQTIITAAKDAMGKGGILTYFMPTDERIALLEALKGEEAEGIAETVAAVVEVIAVMPETFETNGQGREAVVHLHYFHGGSDWYITEKDAGDGSDDRRQHQAFGLACLDDPQDAELGYISIAELIANGVELDLYWKPRPVGDIMAALEAST